MIGVLEFCLSRSRIVSCTFCTMPLRLVGVVWQLGFSTVFFPCLGELYRIYLPLRPGFFVSIFPESGREFRNSYNTRDRSGKLSIDL